MHGGAGCEPAADWQSVCGGLHTALGRRVDNPPQDAIPLHKSPRYYPDRRTAIAHSGSPASPFPVPTALVRGRRYARMLIVHDWVSCLFMNPATAQPEEQLHRDWLYQPNPAYYDEMVAAEGTLRPNWRPLIEPLKQMGPAEFARRWQEGRRVIHENGTTYNVYSDPQSAGRPWPLDPLPMVLDSVEWSYIAAAIAQRAKLLNAIFEIGRASCR